MKFGIKDYKEALKNVEKWAKEQGINLEAYDFEFLSDGYNCQLTWNPTYHKMPHSEIVRDLFTGKEKTIYYTYFQLSQKCSSICSSSGDFDKTRILARLRDTRRNERIDKLEKIKSETARKGLKLFAITSSGDKFALLQAQDLKMDSSNHNALIIGGEFDGCTVFTEWYGQIIGFRSEMIKFIASKRWVNITKKGKQAIY